MGTLAPVLDPTFAVAATICSILPREDGQDHTVIMRTHGAYPIFHPHEGEPYKLSYVTHKVDYADVGDYDPGPGKREKRQQHHFDAKQIADDICHQINDNGSSGPSFFGVFVCKGSEPTEKELADAHARLTAYFERCVAEADAQWSEAPVHSLVSGVAKRAGRWLKLNPENHGWMSNFQVMEECPACGTRIKPNVAICKACGAILDEEKAEKFGLINKDRELTQKARRARQIDASS